MAAEVQQTALIPLSSPQGSLLWDALPDLLVFVLSVFQVQGTFYPTVIFYNLWDLELAMSVCEFSKLQEVKNTALR